MTRQPRHRLSVVVEVAEPARAALAKALEPLVAGYPGVQWLEPAQWCVDVCPLGAVDPERTEPIVEVVAEVASTTPQMALRLDGGAGIATGCAFFAGIHHSDALTELRDELTVRFAARGVSPAPGELVPHCVIGRAAGGGRLPPALARRFRGPIVTWTARRLLVVRTRLRLGGIGHEVRFEHAFGLPAPALR